MIHTKTIGSLTYAFLPVTLFTTPMLVTSISTPLRPVFFDREVERH